MPASGERPDPRRGRRDPLAVPPQGFVTFIDRGKTRPKRDPGYSYRMAGWELAGRTKGGLYALRLDPSGAEPEAPLPFVLPGQLALDL